MSLAELAPVLVGECLEALLAELPDKPGVYLMKDRHGGIVYVGKAKSLRNRVRSYFRASGDTRPFVSWLDRVLGGIEIRITASEKEALLLERDLIGAHHPRYNVDLRDDKNFLCLRLSADHPFPRLYLERRRPGYRNLPTEDVRAIEAERQAGRWFGPYPSAKAARDTLRFLQRTFQLRVCTDAVFQQRKRPCLLYGVKKCSGPCSQPVLPEVYAQQVAQAGQFLRGRLPELVEELGTRMQAAAESQAYEEAARLRDERQAIQRALARQQVVDPAGGDRDVLALYREGARGLLFLMQIRAGRWSGALQRPFENNEAPADDLLRQFLLQHYEGFGEVPPEILVPPEALSAGEGGDEGLREVDPSLGERLSEIRSGRVRVSVPLRGRLAELLRLAGENARESYRTHRALTQRKETRLERLQQRLGLTRLPQRIECIDLSTLGGRFSVGSLTVLLAGEPAPAEYRRYSIRTAAPDSDVEMMVEVITRRFRAVRAGEEAGPDLLVLDGGLPQLHAIETLFQAWHFTGVPLVALAKGGAGAGRHKVTHERVFVSGRVDPIALGVDSDELFLLSRVRDEAHRFAQAYHKKLRRKASLLSLLDEIPGIGPVLRRRLLARFGSLKRIREADVEELCHVPGVSEPLALQTHDFLRQLPRPVRR